MVKGPSENIIKLRALTEEICKRESHDDYKEIVFQLKEIVNGGKEEIASSKTIKNKDRCYE